MIYQRWQAADNAGYPRPKWLALFGDSLRSATDGNWLMMLIINWHAYFVKQIPRVLEEGYAIIKFMKEDFLICFQEYYHHTLCNCISLILMPTEVSL